MLDVRTRLWTGKTPQAQDRFAGIGGVDDFTKFYCPCNSPLNGNAFLDVAAGKAIKSVGVIGDNSQSVFGGLSAKFVSASGTYLQVDDSADWAMGNNDFCFEWRYRANGLPALAACHYIFAQYQGASDYWYVRLNHPNLGPISTISATPTFGGTGGYFADQVVGVVTGDGNATVKIKTVVGGVVTAMYTAPVSAGTGYATGTGQATDPAAGNGDLTINVTAISGSGVYKWQFVLISGGATIASNYVTATVATATWYGMAFRRYGNLWGFYQDGNLVGTATNVAAAFPDYNSLLYIGWLGAGTNYHNGWMDEIRISKGIARRTANYSLDLTPWSKKNW